MSWILKKHVALPAIAPRRRMIATAIVYGLSLAVRFTSETGVEAHAPVQAAVIVDGARAADPGLPFRFNQPVALYRGWPLAARSCRAACESSVPMSPIPGCAPFP